MKIICFVPIKLNSQRLPNKMMLPLGNKLLCQHVFETLLEIKKTVEIDIYCYCSDEQIIKFLPNGVKFLKRDKSLDDDQTLGIEIYMSFIKQVDADIYMLCHATSPFIKKNSIMIGLNKIINEDYDSACSVSKVQTFCWYQGKTLNYELSNVVKTQDITPIYWETSAFYIFKKEILSIHKRRVGNSPYLVETDKIESVDIDEKEDYDLACKICNINNDIAKFYEKFINYHYLFRNPCGEKRLAKNVIGKLINLFPGIIIIDGGYNIGEWTSQLLKANEKNLHNINSIIGYEININAIEKNIVNDNKLILLNKGLSDEKCKIFINPTNDNTESFTITDTLNGSNMVELIRLDQDLQKYNFDNLIIKLDIESYELKAIKGCEKIMDKILMIQFEYHNYHKNTIKPLKEYINYLHQFGFKIFILGEYELLNISDYWKDEYDICNENFTEKINKRPNYDGGFPNYNTIDINVNKINYRPENINLIAFKNNIINLVNF